MKTGPLHLTTEALRQLCHTLKLAGVDCFIINWSMIPPEQLAKEANWVKIAWARDARKVYRSLYMNKPEVKP